MTYPDIVDPNSYLPSLRFHVELSTRKPCRLH